MKSAKVTGEWLKLATEIEQELTIQSQDDKEYIAQARRIILNLHDSINSTFRLKVMQGLIKPDQMPKLTAEDMRIDTTRNAEMVQGEGASAEQGRSASTANHGQELVTGLFHCGKCKGTNTTCVEMSRRCADEPMRTLVTCLGCGNGWKIC